MLEAVPIFHVERAGRPVGVLREGSTRAMIDAGADHESRTGACCVRIGVEASVEEETAPTESRRSIAKRLFPFIGQNKTRSGGNLSGPWTSGTTTDVPSLPNVQPCEPDRPEIAPASCA